MDINAIITLVFVIVGAAFSGLRVLISYERLRIERRRERRERQGIVGLFMLFSFCLLFIYLLNLYPMFLLIFILL